MNNNGGDKDSRNPTPLKTREDNCKDLGDGAREYSRSDKRTVSMSFFGQLVQGSDYDWLILSIRRILYLDSQGALGYSGTIKQYDDDSVMDVFSHK